MNEENYWEQFLTNVGLITSRDKKDNIMAAAWTYQISYEPGMIAVCMAPDITTRKIIEKSKEFGVHLASVKQNVISSIAGGSSGKKIDKIAVLKDLGYKFFEGKKIKTLMMENCALCVECKLKKKIDIGGDHIIYIGEVVEVHNQREKPLAYMAGKYFELGEKIEKPSEEELKKIRDITEKHEKK